MKEPKPMQEIHKIQEMIYEEEKGLTRSERVKKRRREAEEIIRKYGLKFRKIEKKAA